MTRSASLRRGLSRFSMIAGLAAVAAIVWVATAADASAQDPKRPLFSSIEVRNTKINSDSSGTTITAEMEVFAYKAYSNRGGSKEYLSLQPRFMAKGILYNYDENKDQQIDVREFREIEDINRTLSPVSSPTSNSYSIRETTFTREQLDLLFAQLDSNNNELLDANELQRFDMGSPTPDGFERMREAFIINVSFVADFMPRPIEERRATVDANTQTVTVTFGPFRNVPRNGLRAGESWQRLLPGQYTIWGEFNVATQPTKFKAFVWEDSVVKLNDGTIFFARSSPDDLRPGAAPRGTHPEFTKESLRGRASIAIGGYDPNDTRSPYTWGLYTDLEAARDHIEYYRIKIHGFSNVLRRLDAALATEPGNQSWLAAKAEMLYLRDHVKPKDSNGREIPEERVNSTFDALTIQLQPIVEFIDWWRYHRKVEFKAMRESLDALFLDLWKKAKLCTPGFTPSGNYADGSPRTLKKERDRWFRHPPKAEDGTGGGSAYDFLSCPDDESECKGMWERDTWLEWLGAEQQADTSWRFRTDGTAPKDTWLEMVVELELKLKRLYGLKDGEAEAGDPIEDTRGGIMVSESGGRWICNAVATIWEAEYRLASDAVQTLRKIAMSYANRLCADHTDEGAAVSYAFCKYDSRGNPDFTTEDPDGRLNDAVRFYTLLSNNPKAFYNSLDLYSLQPPASGGGIFNAPANDPNAASPGDTAIPENLPD